MCKIKKIPYIKLRISISLRKGLCICKCNLRALLIYCLFSCDPVESLLSSWIHGRHSEGSNTAKKLLSTGLELRKKWDSKFFLFLLLKEWTHTYFIIIYKRIEEYPEWIIQPNRRYSYLCRNFRSRKTHDSIYVFLGLLDSKRNTNIWPWTTKFTFIPIHFKLCIIYKLNTIFSTLRCV